MPKTARMLLSTFTLLTLLFGAMPVQPAYAATFTVSKTTDTNDGTCDADCSLREAIAAANAAAGADTITVPAGTYTLTLGSELLTTSDMTINGAGAGTTIIQADATPFNVNYRVLRNNGGTVTISGVTIQNGQCTGSCAGPLQYHGGGIANQAGNLTLDATTVSSHYASTGGGIYNYSGTLRVQSGSLITENEARFEGGGIYNQIGGTTTIDASTVSLNKALYGTGSPDGGGIANYGTLIIQNGSLIGGTGAANIAVRGGGIFNAGSTTITDSTVNSNEATSNGGGIYNSGGTLTITESVFSGNTATTTSGGIFIDGGTATVTGSTFSDNSAQWGGGIYNDGTLTVTNSAFSGNRATNSFSEGGGILNNRFATVTNSTFSNNSAAAYGGGISHVAYNNPGSLTVTNSTFSGNSATSGGGMSLYGFDTVDLAGNVFVAGATGANCFWTSGSIQDNGYNLSSDASCLFSNTGSANNATLDLNALAENGGPTKTHALGASSAALDAIPYGTTISNNSVNWTCNNANTFTDQRGVARPQGSGCDSGAYEKIAGPFPTFADVPTNAFAWAQIESIHAAGITGGCSASPLNYCPGNPVTRAQMAVFLLRGIHGSNYTPPAATGTVFNDVGAGDFAAAWVEQLAAEGITSGCGGGNYCPNAIVTRAQMSVFLLRAKYGSAYAPPAATGTAFTDVPLGSFADAWIEQMVSEGITSGCGGGNYCPGNPVTRAQMAVFLQRTFGLPLP